MTNRERVIEYLRSIAPKSATNADICSGTRIAPHNQVFQITHELMVRGVIKGRQHGHEWYFTFGESVELARPPPVVPGDGKQTPAEFESAARLAMSRYFNVPLGPAQVPGVPKKFDLVSDDRGIVGDAKYYSLVQDERAPPAKFSVIAEHVWLLEKTGAPTQFLVFGHDRRVPEKWLAKFGTLAQSCEFYFLTADGQLQRLGGAS